MKSLTLRKRTPKRSSVFISAQVNAGTGIVDARIRDLSPDGASVEADTSPPIGASVELIFAEVLVQGRVTWAEDRRFGVIFSDPLAIESMLGMPATRLIVAAPSTYPQEHVDDEPQPATKSTTIIRLKGSNRER